jgi:hypothetical protein
MRVRCRRCGSGRRLFDYRWVIVVAARRLAELADALAERAADLWQLAHAEDHDHDSQDYDDFQGSKVHFRLTVLRPQLA